MRKLYLVAVLLLAGCGSFGESVGDKADAVIKQTVAICAFKPLKDGVIAMLTASNPALVGVGPIASAICAAAKAYDEHSAYTLFGDCPEVNGICVEGEFVDPKSL